MTRFRGMAVGILLALLWHPSPKTPSMPAAQELRVQAKYHQVNRVSYTGTL